MDWPPVRTCRPSCGVTRDRADTVERSRGAASVADVATRVPIRIAAALWLLAIAGAAQAVTTVQRTLPFGATTRSYLLHVATGYARRWHDLAQAPEDRSAALFLLVRLAWDADRMDEMNARTEELQRLLRDLPPGWHQGRAMVMVAQ